MTEHDTHAGHHHHHDHAVHPAEGPGTAAAETVKDPVCGMAVNPATADFCSQYRGKSYFFCSAIPYASPQ